MTGWCQQHGEIKSFLCGTSLVVQWIRICCQCRDTSSIPGPGRSQCHEATKPLYHNYWRPLTLWSKSHSYWAQVLQLLKPTCLKPRLGNKTSHCSVKPMHHNEGLRQPKQINKTITLKKYFRKSNSNIYKKIIIKQKTL